MKEDTVNQSMVKVLSRKSRLRPRIIIITSCLVFGSLLAGFIYYYNSLVSMQLDAKEAAYQVEVALQFRENLFPLLVESVVRFVSHEDHVFDYTIDNRAASIKAPTNENLRKMIKNTKTDWKGVLSKIMAWSENYPDIKTSVNFQTMMKQMSDGEKEIFDRRAAYNKNVNIYTTALTTFPRNIIGYLFNFKEMQYYEISGEAEWQMAARQTGNDKGSAGK